MSVRDALPVLFPLPRVSQHVTLSPRLVAAFAADEGLQLLTTGYTDDAPYGPTPAISSPVQIRDVAGRRQFLPDRPTAVLKAVASLLEGESPFEGMRLPMLANLSRHVALQAGITYPYSATHAGCAAWSAPQKTLLLGRRIAGLLPLRDPHDRDMLEAMACLHHLFIDFPDLSDFPGFDLAPLRTRLEDLDTPTRRSTTYLPLFFREAPGAAHARIALLREVQTDLTALAAATSFRTLLPPLILTRTG